MIELPIIGDDAIEIDMLVSPVFCRLKALLHYYFHLPNSLKSGNSVALRHA
jgi:hypothetical protein